MGDVAHRAAFLVKRLDLPTFGWCKMFVGHRGIFLSVVFVSGKLKDTEKKTTMSFSHVFFAQDPPMEKVGAPVSYLARPSRLKSAAEPLAQVKVPYEIPKGVHLDLSQEPAAPRGRDGRLRRKRASSHTCALLVALRI